MEPKMLLKKLPKLMCVSQIRKKKQLMIDMEMKTTNKDIDKILMILTLRIYSIFFLMVVLMIYLEIWAGEDLNFKHLHLVKEVSLVGASLESQSKMGHNHRKKKYHFGSFLI